MVKLMSKQEKKETKKRMPVYSGTIYSLDGEQPLYKVKLWVVLPRKKEDVQEGNDKI